MRMQATQLRRNNNISPFVLTKGEAVVKRQFKNSMIQNKRSTGGFKFQNKQSSKEAKRLKPNDYQYATGTSKTSVSLGAMTVKRVQTLNKQLA